MSNIGKINIPLSVDGSGFATEAAAKLRASAPAIAAAGGDLGKVVGDNVGREIGNGVSTWVKGALSVAALTAGAAMATNLFAGFVSSGIALSDELQELGANLQLGASQVLLMREAATQSGLSFDTLSSAISRTYKTLGEALNGSASAAQSFAAIGLSIEQLRGMAPDQLFATVSQSLLGTSDAAQRVAYATAIMGKGAMESLPLLLQSADAADMLTERWIRLGAVITDADIAAGAGVADRIDLITATFDRFKILLATEMVPYLEAALNWIDEIIVTAGGIGPLAENIANKFGDWGGVVIDVAQVITGLGQTISGVVRLAYNGVTMLMGGFEVFVGSVGEGFSSIIEWSGDALESIGRTMEGIANGMLSLMENAGNWLANGVIDALNAIIRAYNSIVPDFMSIGQLGSAKIDLGQMDGNFISDFGSTLKELSGTVSMVSKAFSDSGEELIASSNFESAIEQVGNGFENISAVLGTEGQRWSTTFSEGIKNATAAVSAGTGAARPTPQTPAYSSGYGNNAAPSAATFRSQPSTGIMRSPSYEAPRTGNAGGSGATFNFNQTFQTGLDAQRLAQTTATMKKEVIAAIEDKARRGGEFSKTITC